MKLLTLKSNIVLLAASLLLTVLVAVGADIARMYEYPVIIPILDGLWFVGLLATVGLLAMAILRLIVSQAAAETVEPPKSKAELAGEENLRNLYDNAEWVERRLRKFRADRQDALKDIDTIRALLKTMVDLAYGVGQKSVVLSREAQGLDELNQAITAGDPVAIQRAIPKVRDEEIKRMAGRGLDNLEYQHNLSLLVARMAGETEAQAIAYNDMLRGIMERVTEAKSRLLVLQQAADSSKVFEPLALLHTDLNRVGRVLQPFIVQDYQASNQIEAPKEYLAIEANNGLAD